MLSRERRHLKPKLHSTTLPKPASSSSTGDGTATDGPPTVLAVGDYVKCRLSPDSTVATAAAPVLAIISAFDEEYQDAVKRFEDEKNHDKASHSLVDLTRLDVTLGTQNTSPTTPTSTRKPSASPSPSTAAINQQHQPNTTSQQQNSLPSATPVTPARVRFSVDVVDPGSSSDPSRPTECVVPGGSSLESLESDASLLEKAQPFSSADHHWSVKNVDKPKGINITKTKHNHSNIPATGKAAIAAATAAAAASSKSVIPVTVGKAYVHFVNQDNRLDRWVPVSELSRASASSPSGNDGTPNNNGGGSNQTRKITRAMKRQHDEENPSHDVDLAIDTRLGFGLGSKQPVRRPSAVRKISKLVFGDHCVPCWYNSPLPKQLEQHDVLYTCGMCLKFESSTVRYEQHRFHCPVREPPGGLIYHQTKCKANGFRTVRVYEMDGQLNYRFCTRLARISKLFLEHKSVCYDICPFDFFVITLDGEIAGYFSKEKAIIKSKFNLACILTFPQHQRKGVGRFLIDFSYQLSRREGKIGSPERPLSDLGNISYRRYWGHVVVTWLRQNHIGVQAVPLSDIINATGICETDLIATLRCLNLTHIFKGEYFADASTRLLDMAAMKISAPILVFDKACLRGRWAKLNPIVTLIGGSGSGRGARTGDDDTAATGDTANQQHHQGLHINGNGHNWDDDGGGGSRTKTVGGMKVSTTAVATRFSGRSASMIYKFIRQHTAVACLRSGRQRGGLHIAVWKDFALSLNMPISRVRKKVREVAQRQINEQEARIRKYNREAKMNNGITDRTDGDIAMNEGNAAEAGEGVQRRNNSNDHHHLHRHEQSIKANDVVRDSNHNNSSSKVGPNDKNIDDLGYRTQSARESVRYESDYHRKKLTTQQHVNRGRGQYERRECGDDDDEDDDDDDDETDYSKFNRNETLVGRATGDSAGSSSRGKAARRRREYHDNADDDVDNHRGGYRKTKNHMNDDNEDDDDDDDVDVDDHARRDRRARTMNQGGSSTQRRVRMEMHHARIDVDDPILDDADDERDNEHNYHSNNRNNSNSMRRRGVTHHIHVDVDFDAGVDDRRVGGGNVNMSMNHNNSMQQQRGQHGSNRGRSSGSGGGGNGNYNNHMNVATNSDMEVDVDDFDDDMRRRRGRVAARRMDVIDLSSGRPSPDHDVDADSDINNNVDTDPAGAASAGIGIGGSGVGAGPSQHFDFDSDDSDHDDGTNYGVVDRRGLHYHHIDDDDDSNDDAQLASSSVTRRLSLHRKRPVEFVEVGRNNDDDEDDEDDDEDEDDDDEEDEDDDENDNEDANNIIDNNNNVNFNRTQGRRIVYNNGGSSAVDSNGDSSDIVVID